MSQSLFAEESLIRGRHHAAILAALGRAGAYGRLVESDGDLTDAAEALAAIAESSLPLAVGAWAHNATIHDLWAAGAESPARDWLAPLARGDRPAGTGLCNALRAACGIEPFALTGRPVADGWRVRGTLPWAAHVAPGHVFTVVFDTPDGRRVAALADADLPGIEWPDQETGDLAATRTRHVHFRRVFLPAENIIDPDGDRFLGRVRTGFILLQVGLGLGLIRAAAADIARHGAGLGGVNRFLPLQADEVTETAGVLAERLAELARDPRSPETFPAALRLRLAVAEEAGRAAWAAVQHAGLAGLATDSPEQRRLREAALLNLLTPAVRDIRRELAIG